MEYTTEKHNTSFSFKSKAKLASNFWAKILAIGLTAEMTLGEQKRTKLLNSICFVASLTYLGYVLVYSHPNYRLTFWECFLAMAAYCIPLLLNYLGRYQFAIHF